MAIQTTNVSIVADKDYLHKLAVVAKARQLRMGDLVRQAVDAQFGDALRQVDTLLQKEGGNNESPTNPTS